MSLLDEIGIGVVVFAATNVDDVFILALFFADARVDARAVVAGQFLGIGVLWLASALASVAALAAPPEWLALLGIAPLALGVRQLLEFRAGTRSVAESDSLGDHPRTAETARRTGGSSALSVAAVTIANGGDNLAAYVPLFATSAASVPLYGLVFAEIGRAHV